MKYSKAVRQTRVIWLVTGAIAILVAVAAGALSVLWREQWKPQPKAAPVQTMGSAGDISLSGRIQAQHAVLVPVPVEGKIDVFHVDIGQEVYEGQLLAQIKSDSLDTAGQQAAEVAESARTRVNDLEASLIAARLEASRARALASRTRSEFDRSEKAYQRQRMLLGAGATPRMVFEKAEKQFQADQAESTGAETLAQQAESRATALVRDLDAAKKALDEKTEELERARAELAAAQVHSPVDGIVAGRRGNAGDDVDRTMKDLFQIATDPSQLAVIVEPAPPVLARIRPGQTAVVTVAEAQNEPLAAEVKKVENGQVTIEFVSPDPAVKPGLTAQVRIKLT